MKEKEGLVNTFNWFKWHEQTGMGVKWVEGKDELF